MEIRYIARIIIEAETPLSVGSGQKGLTIDRMVAKDANYLPYIPGTSLCGVLRHSFHALQPDLADDLFGFGGKEGRGSRLKISAAHLVGEDGQKIIEGLQNIQFKSGFYAYFNRLPERDHVRMTEKGAADSKNHGKYDEQLVHKGTRFAFEIELIGTLADKASWEQLLNLFSSPIFRIGAGTRKGFGKIKVVAERSVSKTFNLKNKADLLNYLAKSSALNGNYNGWKSLTLPSETLLQHWTKKSLSLTAQDFFLFSAGFGDEDADSIPKTESYFEWTTGKPVLKQEKMLLIPATSVKGALAHRIAYHYNKLTDVTIGQLPKTPLKTVLDIEKLLNSFGFGFEEKDLNIASNDDKWAVLEKQINDSNYAQSVDWQSFNDDLDEEVALLKLEQFTGEHNKAVYTLFGRAKNSEASELGLRGSVIINDIYLPYQAKKVFNHTKIDRFTNGTMDGALFQEKVAAYNNAFTIDIWVENKALEDKNVADALEKTLDELMNGQLALGGSTTKGHGVFKGNKI
jgi:CRISPR/Cas system CSM-associated protein Csm3 (group 7 of RAMP superfamily)